MTEWQIWHDQYADPASPLSQRLTVVREQIDLALDRAPAGPIRLLSLCAGDGRDVLPRLAVHPRGPDVHGALVEFDDELAARARLAAPDGVKVVQGDAGDPAVYDGSAPADLLLLCGILGNIELRDLERTIAAVPHLLRPGGTVLWTRHLGAPDATPWIRELFSTAGIEETAFLQAQPPYRWSVGAGLRRDDPGPLEPLPSHLFTFSTRPDRPELG